MTFEEGVFARLSADVGLQALVGTRIWPVAQPQDGSYPSVVFRTRDAHGEYGLWDSLPITVKVVEFNCFAMEYGQARQTGEAVRALFERFSGSLGSADVITSLLLSDKDVDPSELGGENVFCVRIWMQVTYQ